MNEQEQFSAEKVHSFEVVSMTTDEYSTNIQLKGVSKHFKELRTEEITWMPLEDFTGKGVHIHFKSYDPGDSEASTDNLDSEDGVVIFGDPEKLRYMAKHLEVIPMW